MSKDTITVYWAPSLYIPLDQSWAFLYSEPSSLNTKIISKSKPKTGIRFCPAVKDSINNLYTLKSNVEEDFYLDLNKTKEIMDTEELKTAPIPHRAGTRGPKVQLSKARNPEYEEYYNYIYNLSWAFFADQPLEVKLTSPYLPPSSPMEGSFLAPGKFDIGQWYRPINLEYITPITSDHFKLEMGQDLAYLEFLTDKKIVFKQYFMDDVLYNLYQEFIASDSRYFGFLKSLSSRYLSSQKSKLPQMILSQIKKNVIE